MESRTQMMDVIGYDIRNDQLKKELERAQANFAQIQRKMRKINFLIGKLNAGHRKN